MDGWTVAGMMMIKGSEGWLAGGGLWRAGRHTHWLLSIRGLSLHIVLILVVSRPILFLVFAMASSYLMVVTHEVSEGIRLVFASLAVG